MRDYYQQKGVRQAILDFVYSGSSVSSRECAFYNSKIGEVQRHPPWDKDGSVLVIDSERDILRAARVGATAFYASYWRYSNPSEASGVRGRDIVWSLRATEGGLTAVKRVTEAFLAGLEEEGFHKSLVKYSGKLGFDILVPIERVQAGSPKDLDFISEVQRDLTERASNRVEEDTSFQLEEKGTTFRLSGSMGTCLLTELRWRRGLLLAPMSLHPGSGLVSIPLLASEIPNFSVVDASPEKVHPREWSFSFSVSGELVEDMVRYSPKGIPVRA